MKLVSITVLSLDGKSTRRHEEGSLSWASKEDQKLFADLRKEYGVLIMGSTTYMTALPHVNFKVPLRRIVMTHEPEKYEQHMREGVEFTSQPPEAILRRLESEGQDKALLVGGAEINRLFFDAGLVDEVIVDVEPVIFGDGKPFVEGLSKDVQLKLHAAQKLNKQGTMMLHYKVQKATG